MTDDKQQHQTNEIDLTPADEALLDTVWDMLDKRWKAEDEAAKLVKQQSPQQ